MPSRYTYPAGGGSPPPSYRTDTETVQSWGSPDHSPATQSYAREDTPLLSGKPQRPRFYLGFIGLLALCCVLVSAILATVTFQVATSGQRSSWDREVKQHNDQRVRMDQERLSWQETINQERMSLQQEIKKHANISMEMRLERVRWEHERELWQIERERWAEEQRQRESHQPFWGAPRRASDRCLTYGTREYTAKLYNVLTTEKWADKCANTAIEINGRTHASPVRCEDHGSDEGIYGYWLINYSELECEPTWEKFWRGDCDHIPGHRRWESVLWNIHPGDDGYEMCRSTPVTLPTGHYFPTTKCEDRRNWGPNGWRGWYGKWDVPDSTCNN